MKSAYVRPGKPGAAVSMPMTITVLTLLLDATESSLGQY